MCLGVPGKISEIFDADSLQRSGKVDFSGVVREVNLAYVPEANVGDYVIVHAGFAISILDEKEAGEVFRYLEEMNKVNLKTLQEQIK